MQGVDAVADDLAGESRRVSRGLSGEDERAAGEERGEVLEDAEVEAEREALEHPGVLAEPQVVAAPEEHRHQALVRDWTPLGRPVEPEV